jgi:Coatomer epsilon subunit
MQDQCLATLQGWLDDPTSSHNATVCPIAGIIYANEKNYVEALKACHAGTSLEMYASHIKSHALL